MQSSANVRAPEVNGIQSVRSLTFRSGGGGREDRSERNLIVLEKNCLEDSETR